MNERLINTAEIARLANVSPSVVGNWKRRYDDFPKPSKTISGRSIYNESTVLSWIAKRGFAQNEYESTLWGFSHKLRNNLSLLQIALIIELITTAISIQFISRNAKGEPLRKGLLRLCDRKNLRICKHLLDLLDDEILNEIAEAVAGSKSGHSDEISKAIQGLLSGGQKRQENVDSPSLSQLLARLVCSSGTAYDPACGAGSTLTTLAALKNGPQNLYGQETNPEIAALTELRLIREPCQFEIGVGDTLTEDLFPDLRADAIVATPPLSYRLGRDLASSLKNDPRFYWGTPSPSDGAGVWIQHCVYHLSANGRAAIAVNPSFCFQSGSAKKLRANLLRAGIIEAVISLPPGLQNGTSTPLLVLVLRPPGIKRTNVLFIDAESLGEGKTQSRFHLSDKNIEAIAGWVIEWRDANQLSAINPEIALSVSLSEISDNDFILHPRRYLSHEAETASPQKLRPQISKILEDLKADIEKTTKIVKTIDAWPEISQLNEYKFITLKELIKGGVITISATKLSNKLDRKNNYQKEHRPVFIINAMGSRLGSLEKINKLSKFIYENKGRHIEIEIIDTSIIDSGFFEAWLNSNNYLEQIKKFSTGAGIPLLSTSNFQEIKVPIPTLATQHKLGSWWVDIRTLTEILTNLGVSTLDLKIKAGNLVTELSKEGTMEPWEVNE